MLLMSILLMFPQEMFIINACIIIKDTYGDAHGILLTVFIVWSINFIGSILCYFYGKFLMRSIMKKFLRKSKVVELVEITIFDHKGWKFVSLLRILPMNTYSAINYILGFTSLDLCGLFISDLAILPNIILYCLIGVYLKIKLIKYYLLQ